MNTEELNRKIKDVLTKSGLAFEEVRAFFDGLQYLSDLEKTEFISIVEKEPKLVYPLYINFKAKLTALESSEPNKNWDQIVENEILELEKYIQAKGIPEN